MPRASSDLDAFRLVREVGRGGMGVVYEAAHMATGERRAVKLLASCTPDAVERMFREARAASMLRSRHATRIYGVGMTRDRAPYILMELLRGVDLATFLARSPGGLPVDTAMEIVTQACEVVGEAHAYGIVHRDLKPGNIFITQAAGGGLEVKLLDFGLAKLASSERVSSRTSSGLVFGTPHYMSPEQLRSSTDVDARTDVWALGVILAQLVFGRLPFDGQNVSQVIASIMTASPEVPQGRGVPSELRRIILRCLAKKPRARYRHARALADDLRRAPRGTLNVHDFTEMTPRPWCVDEPPELPSSGPLPARWGRLEWAAAIASCTMMLAAGVLTSALGRTVTTTRSAAQPLPPSAVDLPPPASSAPLVPPTAWAPEPANVPAPRSSARKTR